jgi:beta-galactosidase/evolved beta-galactosidase subunit alpha
MDTRWVAFANPAGRGLLAVGQPTLQFSAHRYTLDNLSDTRHDPVLVYGDEITVNLDHRQRGVGSAACGPEPLPAAELPATEFRFSVCLRPLDPRAGTLADQSRQILLR